ncbi:MAG: hypothetical protein B6I31_04035 [Desulfobacteraceae bacterium 4572_19]|nr:MAG: hypothetical protein B6I31_04035 [Desulfobacteraceae bacterium 4572_19]
MLALIQKVSYIVKGYIVNNIHYKEEVFVMKSVKVNYKKLFFYIIVLLAIFSWLECFASDKKSYKVTWVDDGDTVVMSNGQRVRYIGINTPEVAHKDQKAEPFGNKASEYNKTLVLNLKVELERGKKQFDRYGRMLGYLFLKDGTFVNARLLKKGYAYCLYVKPNVKYAKLFLETQQEAMKKRVGIWHKFRETGKTYIGNQKSMRFHALTCPYGSKTGKRNRVRFSRKWEAFYKGYSPCKHCLGKEPLTE